MLNAWEKAFGGKAAANKDGASSSSAASAWHDSAHPHHLRDTYPAPNGGKVDVPTTPTTPTLTVGEEGASGLRDALQEAQAESIPALVAAPPLAHLASKKGDVEAKARPSSWALPKLSSVLPSLGNERARPVSTISTSTSSEAISAAIGSDAASSTAHQQPALLRSLSSPSIKAYASPTQSVDRQALLLGSSGSQTLKASPKQPSPVHAGEARAFGSLARAGADSDERESWDGGAREGVMRLSGEGEAYFDQGGRTSGETQTSIWDFGSKFLPSKKDGSVNASSATASTAEEESGFFGAVARLRGTLGLQADESGVSWLASHRANLDAAMSSFSNRSADDPRDGGAQDGPDDTAPKGASSDDFKRAQLRKQKVWASPKHCIVFAHGLFGFDTLVLGTEGMPLTKLAYWRGITSLLEARGVEVLVARVPASASIEERALVLRDSIEAQFPGRKVNIIGHSMGGLDSRYLISKLEKSFEVVSLTTIATPHRGSPFADYLLDEVIGQNNMPRLVSLISTLGIPGKGAAFDQLKVGSMAKFNEEVQDDPNVKYFSWAAAFSPGLLSEFRVPHGIIYEKEGSNDGLVSVQSSMWGQFQGTLDSNHLELIGWANTIKTGWQRMMGGEEPFDPQTLYLQICEDLANEGL